ncbi:DUF4355 domain-containing protein [Limosilactobacillus reuteri]|uniref:DUF4355 domain-containing protein n=1 Tax=Limosilactobacillus reuteri TaxID=1598 RepID=UPI0013E94000|nr:DUF4355 domain-containing protein [Limosilactobacillus reuteri]
MENENEVQTQQPVQEQDNQPTQNEGQEEKSKVEFTPEQQKAISALLDSKIAKERIKADQEKQNAIDKAIARTKMSAEERAKAEQKDREDEFNRKQQDLDRQLREVKTKSTLIDKGITTDLLPLVMGADDDETSQRLDLLDRYVQKKVQEATEKLMRGKQNPINGNGGSNVSLSDNPWSIQGWNLTKQNEIFNQDPEKARQMIAQAQPKQGFYVGKMN